MDRIDWLKWRKEGIGGSDAPKIMGTSRYGNIVSCYNDKINPFVDEGENSYQAEKGIQAEGKVRSLFELQMGESFEPKLFVMSDKPWLRVSLDGLSSDGKRAAELKFCARAVWEEARLGKVAAEYWPQVQHALMVSSAECVYFVCHPWNKRCEVSISEIVCVTVTPDWDYINNKLFPAELKFWNSVIEKRPPSKSEPVPQKVDGAEEKVKLWKELKQQLDAGYEQLDALRKEIVTIAENTGNKEFVVAGVRVLQKSRKGNVDYSKIPQLQGVDLEPFRKPGSTFWEFEIQ